MIAAKYSNDHNQVAVKHLSLVFVTVRIISVSLKSYMRLVKIKIVGICF
jgi:hypothetical protein